MNIGAPKALWKGAGRVIRNWRLWCLFYFLNLLFAAVLALPFASVFAKDISRSLAGSDLLAGFNYRWYVEFIHANDANGAYFESLVPQIVVLLGVYVLMEVFLAGGFFSVFAEGGRGKVSRFFSECASKFFPILTITIGEIVLLFALYKGDAFWARANLAAAGEALTDAQVLHAELWRYGAVIAAFMIVNLFSDFAKAAVAIDDDTLAHKIWRGLAFAMRHPFASSGTYLGAAIVSAAVIALYYFVESGMHPLTAEGIVLQIAAGQIFILLRIYSKLIFYAGEAALYRENQIEVINVKREMLE